jgi:hypothetical protein
VISYVDIVKMEELIGQVDQNNAYRGDSIKIGYLCAFGCIPPDRDWESFGSNIGRNTHTSRITIKGMNQVGLAAFFRGIASNRSIASMVITECQIDDQGATALATGFSEKNDTLKEISIRSIKDIAGTERITENGWDSIVTSIAGSRLEKLDASWNRTVTDAVVVTLSNSLLSNGTLNYLDLGGCNSITHTGLRALFQQLHSPHSVLETLNLEFVGLNDTA